MRWLLTLVVLTASVRSARAECKTCKVEWQGPVGRLGVAHISGPEEATGNTLGLGYRVELTRWAFEVGISGDALAPQGWDNEWRDREWIATDRLAVRGAYLFPVQEARVWIGGGLGYGTTRIFIFEEQWADSVEWRETGPRGELRIGLVYGEKAIIGVDAGVRLPFFYVDSDHSPAWWPMFDVAVTIGYGIGEE